MQPGQTNIKQVYFDPVSLTVLSIDFIMLPFIKQIFIPHVEYAKCQDEVKAPPKALTPPDVPTT